MKKAVFLSILLMVFLSAGAVQAAAPAKISTPGNPHPWAKVELYGSGVSGMINGQEPIVKFSLPPNSKVKGWFPSDLFVKVGTGSTYSDYNFGDYGYLKSNRYFLLGYGKNWSTAAKAVPVILVHGAGDDMNRAWAHPWSTETPAAIDENGSTSSKTDDAGLMQYLANRGYAVFAVSFPHTQGNNLIQAQLLADAIQVVKSITGKTQVDLIAHSKGNLAAISYMSSMNNEYSAMNWMDDYRGDVRKYIAVASPFKGVDSMFRYYLGNTGVVDQKTNCPVGFYNAYIYYAYRDYYRWDMSSSTYDNYFQGQTQLLHNWVDDPANPIGFSAESLTAGDFNETMYDLYNGGTSFYMKSEGINNVILDANGTQGTGDFINRMNNRGLDPAVKLYVLYGTRQALDYVYGWYPVGEKAAASDGLLFTASASYTAGMTRRGAVLVAKQSYPYNHLEIARETSALSWIAAQLN